jgi:hypothetical protein
VYGCIKESGRLLEHLKEEANGLSYEEYRAKAKRTCFKINAEKDGEKRVKLFKKRLKMFVESINQVSDTVKKSPNTAQRQRRRRHILRSLKDRVP